MTKKDKEKGPDKINFEDLSTVFENNLKIYNQYVESFKNLGAGQNNFPTFPINNQNSNNFTINDLSNLIAPTVTKMMESFKNFQTEIQQHPNIYFDNLNKWVSQIANLNFYFVTRASGGMANPVIFEEKTDKRFSAIIRLKICILGIKILNSSMSFFDITRKTVSSNAVMFS